MRKFLDHIIRWLDNHLDTLAFWSLVAMIGISIGEYVLVAVLLAFGDAQQLWCQQLATLYITLSLVLPGLLLAGFATVCLCCSTRRI